MRFFDYFKLAFKNLTRQKARTSLTIIAITVGSLSLILMMSILISVRQSLMESFEKMGAFDLVTVSTDPNSTDNGSLLSTNGDPSEGKKIDDATLSAVKKLANVVDASPTASVWAKTMKLEGSEKKQWSSLMAYKPDSKVFSMPLLAGRNITSSDMDKVVVGKNFLATYGDPTDPKSLLGKKVILSFDGGMSPDWGTPPVKPPLNADKTWWESQQKKAIEIPAEIVGVADNGAMDDKQSYISLAWARRLQTSVRWENKECQKDQQCDNSMSLVKTDNLATNGYSSIIIKANDENNTKVIADQVKALGYGAATAENMIAQINQIFLLLTVVLGVIGGISLFVAAIGIINTMIMATYERIREIGVMRACGATRATIRRLFTFEAALLGLCGGIFGLVISFALVRVAKYIVETKGASLGNIPVDKIGTFPMWLVLSVIAFTTLLGMIAGLGPAIKAARLNPVDALRYE